MEELGLDANAVSVPHGPNAIGEAIRSLFAAEARPDALIASNGLMMAGLLRALREQGLSVPTDVAAAGFDNEPWMDLIDGALAVIEQPVEEIGRTAMDMLLHRLENPDAAVRRLVLDGRLIKRNVSAR